MFKLQNLEEKLTQWKNNGYLNGIEFKFNKVIAGQLCENQSQTHTSPHLNILTKAIKEAFARNFIFDKVMSFEVLHAIDQPVYFLKYIENKEHLVVADEQIELESIQLKTRLTDDNLAESVQQEIVQIVLNDIRSHITTVEEWNYQPAESYRENHDKFYSFFRDIRNKAYEKNGRGGYNWALMHPKAADIFVQSTGGPCSSHRSNDDGHFFYVGTVGSMFRVYYSWSMPADEMIVGYKGESYLDSPIIYASYVPFSLNFDSITLNMGKWVSPNCGDYLAKIKIKNLVINNSCDFVNG